MLFSFCVTLHEVSALPRSLLPLRTPVHQFQCGSKRVGVTSKKTPMLLQNVPNE